MFISVDLPEPDAPIRATSSPRPIDSDTPFSTGTSTSPRKYVLRRSSSLIRSMISHLVSRRLSLLLLAAKHLRGERIGHRLGGGRLRLAGHQLRALGQIAFEHFRVVAIGVAQLELDG